MKHIPFSQPTPSRAGTIIIMVTGLAGLLCTLALIFLITVCTDLDDMAILVREAQARNMLAAACDYLQEASRIGWDNGSSSGTAQTEFSETFGWIDVRDGELGPRTNTAAYNSTGFSCQTNLPSQTTRSVTGVNLGKHQTPPDYQSIGNNNFQIGKAFRFPMYVMEQPPYAIQLTTAYNPVQVTAPDNGQSFLRHPDPQPVVDNGWAEGTVSATNFQKWCIGNPVPRENSSGMAWFRLVREGSGATFTVTCGAGASLGYRDWSEVLADGPDAPKQFNNDPTLFNSLCDEELRIWYRVEWSPATTAIDMSYLCEAFEQDYVIAAHAYHGGATGDAWFGGMMAPNMGGTIQWIQRLSYEPNYW
jgi:hypothetical protein